ncbi:hypothetical protein M408DRAFT_18734 [Serendipita vermifera MAFF 305830]|uniref:Uncharacterized protein n=1 Tax=Serendipita vermifera MAFF 305830 TaxID=933852 RepID=A0A0C2X6K0_SERVB|nr:hypothetical protein M408DRAFT_18734 [Serendipita vermifera MAFF 305830]
MGSQARSQGIPSVRLSTCAASTTPNDIPWPFLVSKSRTVLKYTARAALGAIVLYAVFGSQSSSGHLVAPSSEGGNTYGRNAAAATHWSVPSSPQATGTPDRVRDADAPAPPKPEDQIVFENLGASPEGSETKETVFDEDGNMDEFLQKLFEEDGIPLPDDLKKPIVPPPSAQKSISEEEKAEIQRLKDIETKEKRADITARHTKWEKKLARAGEEELLELLEKIKEMRKAVVDSMRTKPEMFDLLKKLQEEGFKQVEQTEKYLQKIIKDAQKDEETSSKWTKIVAKVQERLDKRTVETTSYLHNWYQDVMKKEKVVFEASADKLDKLADEGQADIGMDYAWLDDVSTDDWTRYHQLKRDAKGWIEQFETIYNATHVDMQENIVVNELMQVETAMMRVAADLNQALDQVRASGNQWLKGESETSSASSPSASPSGTSKAVETEEAAPSPVESVQETPAIPVPETSTHAEPKHEEL